METENMMSIWEGVQKETTMYGKRAYSHWLIQLVRLKSTMMNIGLLRLWTKHNAKKSSNYKKRWTGLTPENLKGKWATIQEKNYYERNDFDTSTIDYELKINYHCATTARRNPEIKNWDLKVKRRITRTKDISRTPRNIT